GSVSGRRSGSLSGRRQHVTAKATRGVEKSGETTRLGGVRGAARVQGNVRNARGPSWQPSSRQGGSYKPTAKASPAERESEGTVVVTRPVKKNAGRAKGPCGDQVQDAGKREGMTGRTGTNSPDGRKPVDKVRGLQRAPWAAAKRQP